MKPSPDPASEHAAGVLAALRLGVPIGAVCTLYLLTPEAVFQVAADAGHPAPLGPVGRETYIRPDQAEMVRRALSGEPFASIAESFGVTRQWVRQVVMRHAGLSRGDLSVLRAETRRKARLTRCAALAAADPDLSARDLAKQCGIKSSDVAAVLGREEFARRRTPRASSAPSSRQAALENMRRVAALPGGTPLSGGFYDTHRGDGLTRERLIQIFGTWGEAGQIAGVLTHEPVRTYVQRWPREDCLAWVRVYLDQVERGSYVGYDQWQRSIDRAPSPGTVRLRCGRWAETVRDAYALDAADLPTL